MNHFWLVGIGVLLALVGVVLLMWAALYAVRGLGSRRGDTADGDLRGRYESGRIDRETYERQLADLKSLEEPRPPLSES